jgi:hypothetical protein
MTESIGQTGHGYTPVIAGDSELTLPGMRGWVQSNQTNIPNQMVVAP